jgi:hypothetical protein
LYSTAFEPERWLTVFLTTLGALWAFATTEVAIIAGGVTLVAVIALCVPLIRERSAAMAGWVGVAAYACLVGVMVAVARLPTSGANIGMTSRYSAPAMLATSAVIVLFTLRYKQIPVARLAALAIAIGLVTYAVGEQKSAIVRGSYSALGVSAVAMRVNAVQTMWSMQIQPEVIPAAKAMGTYPFTNDFTLGCHGLELGATVNLASMPEAAGVTDTPMKGDALLSGWTLIDGRPADCVLVVDSAGVVVGGGITGVGETQTARKDPKAEGPTGWRAVAGPNAKDPVVVVSSNGVLYRLR